MTDALLTDLRVGRHLFLSKASEVNRRDFDFVKIRVNQNDLTLGRDQIIECGREVVEGTILLDYWIRDGMGWEK